MSIDRNAKFRAYRDKGVREYVLWRVEDEEIDWFVLRDGQYVALAAGEDGILRSEVFPGLWLDPAAMAALDAPRVHAVLLQGIASPEHAAFVERHAPAPPREGDSPPGSYTIPLTHPARDPPRGTHVGHPTHPPPPQKFTFTIWLILIIASIGFAFDIYELLMLPLVLRPGPHRLRHPAGRRRRRPTRSSRTGSA